MATDLGTENKPPGKLASPGAFLGAGNRARTDDIQLGKLTLYQLSYARTRLATNSLKGSASRRGVNDVCPEKLAGILSELASGWYGLTAEPGVGKMTSKVWRTCGVWMGLAFALLGCDRESDSVRVVECQKVCDKRDMCIRDTDVVDCHKRCEDQEFRSDLYYQAKATCVSDGTFACDEWAQELDNRGEDLCRGEDCVLDGCVQRALAREKVSKEQAAYCDELSNRLVARCDSKLGLGALEKRCKDTLREVSQAYAQDTRDCVLGGCGEAGECLEDLAVRYGTDIQIFKLPK